MCMPWVSVRVCVCVCVCVSVSVGVCRRQYHHHDTRVEHQLDYLAATTEQTAAALSPRVAVYSVPAADYSSYIWINTLYMHKQR